MTNRIKPFSFGARQLASYTVWSAVDSVALRASDALVQILLVVLLIRSDYGLLGLAMGYLQMVAFFSVQPESALLRFLPKANTDAGRRKLLGRCYAVTMHKSWLLSFRFVLIALVIGLGFGWNLAAITLALGVLTELRLLQYAMAMFLKLADKNGKAVVLNFAFRILQLSCLAVALYWQQSIWSYVAAMTACQLLATVALWVLTVVELKLRWWPRWSDAAKFWPILVNFVGWAHLCSYITGLIFAVHIVFLSWAGADLDTVGTFSVGVRIAAFCFIVPMAIQGAATLAISSVENHADRLRRLGAYVRMLSVISLTQLIGYMLVGHWLLELLFQLKGHPHAAAAALEIYQMSLPLVIGATLLNCLRPFTGYAMSTMEMWRYTTTICVPAVMITLVAYAVTASWGATAIGWAALVCYPLFGLVIACVAIGPVAAWKCLFEMTDAEKTLINGLRPRFAGAVKLRGSADVE